MIDVTDEKTWREMEEQAFRDLWALRILDCPLARCRRSEQCRKPQQGCLGLTKYPNDREKDGDRLKMLQLLLRERLAAVRAGPEAAAAHAAEGARDLERRDRLAFERARETLRLRREGRGRGSGAL